MKKLIVLPGNSPKNKEWADIAVAAYGDWFDELYVQYYDHWISGDELIDFAREQEKLQQVVAADPDDTEYYIFAKSFGTILAFLAVHSQVLKPTKCIFFGISFNMATENKLFSDDWEILRGYRVPTVAFHNTNDPVADPEHTRTILTKRHLHSVRFVTIPDNDHAYTDFSLYKPLMNAFLNL